MSSEDLMRVGQNFKKEIREIKEARKGKKNSDRLITNLICRSVYWNKMKEDIIEYGGEEDEG